MWGMTLSRQSEMPLSRQIYQAIRDGILAGRISPGEALPSTRALASALAVGRNTVNEAYDMLLAEGFVITHQGAATRVAEGLFLEQPAAPAQPKPNEGAGPTPLVDFRTGQPDLRAFPRYLWIRLMREAAEGLPLEQFGYTGPEGYPALRREIAAWLYRSRGLLVDPQSVLITAGATQALHLLADLLYREGHEMLIEDPCHVGMLRALQGKGYPVRPIPVDASGLCTEALDRRGGGPAGPVSAVYITPSHQFPLGGVLPAGRRAALVRFARENDLYIIEDDYDSEFRYSGAPVAPLHALDPQRVIYVGTFSKVVFPALRIGYAILPPALHAGWRNLRLHMDVQNPLFEQAAMAEFLRARKIDRHVQHMRKIYGQRRQVLLGALDDAFGSAWQPWGDAAGLHLAVQFEGKTFDAAFVERCKQQRVRAVAIEHHCIRKGLHRDKLLLGYGHLEPEAIRQGINLLKKAV